MGGMCYTGCNGHSLKVAMYLLEPVRSDISCSQGDTKSFYITIKPLSGQNLHGSARTPRKLYLGMDTDLAHTQDSAVPFSPDMVTVWFSVTISAYFLAVT